MTFSKTLLSSTDTSPASSGQSLAQLNAPASAIALLIDVRIRKPFRSKKLPLVCRLLASAYRAHYSKYRQFALSLPALAAFGLLRLMGLRFNGQFDYLSCKGQRSVTFDALNTQFGAIYFPAYAMAYEPEVGAFLDAVIDPHDVFLDVGSNWGYFAAWIASREDFIGQVIAFEPFPRTFKNLVDTIRQCGISDRVVCHQIALSDHIGECCMSIPDFVQSGQAQLTRVRKSKPIIRTRPLDSFRLSRVDVIKIDVEGHEERVIAGGRTTIERFQPLIIFESGRSGVNLEQTLKPMKLLQALGYSFYEPCWLHKIAGENCLVADTAPFFEISEQTLVLKPLQLMDRFLRNGCNLIACHQDRVVTLRQRFERH